MGCLGCVFGRSVSEGVRHFQRSACGRCLLLCLPPLLEGRDVIAEGIDSIRMSDGLGDGAEEVALGRPSQGGQQGRQRIELMWIQGQLRGSCVEGARSTRAGQDDAPRVVGPASAGHDAANRQLARHTTLVAVSCRLIRQETWEV